MFTNNQNGVMTAPTPTSTQSLRTRRNVLVMAALVLAALCGPLHGSARGAEQPDPPPGKLGGGNK